MYPGDGARPGVSGPGAGVSGAADAGVAAARAAGATCSAPSIVREPEQERPHLRGVGGGINNSMIKVITAAAPPWVNTSACNHHDTYKAAQPLMMDGQVGV